MKDWYMRLENEARELSERIERLDKFLSLGALGAHVDDVPDMQAQLAAMREYEAAVRRRLERNRPTAD